MAKLKHKVKKAYYNKVYILVRVVAPPKKFEGGALKTPVYEAKAGEISVKNYDGIVSNRIVNNITTRFLDL